MRITVRDIAKRASVSPATVSNALGGRAGVSKAVREHVITIAQEMGYQSGRENKRTSQHVRLIIYKAHGLVVMDTLFFAELTESIQLECRRFNLELLISHLSTREDTDMAEQIRAFCAEECAGIILLGTEMSDEELKQFSNTRSPLLVLDNSCRGLRMHAIVMNNVDAGYQAALTLYRAGHRKIEHITSSVPFSNMTERCHGLTAGLAECGVTLSKSQIWLVRPTMNGAYEDMTLLIRQRKYMPEAFFAGNDLMAIGCMRAITEAGYKIPDDVSMMGMDDTSICQASTPQLSTIHVYKRDLGVTAIRTLLALIDESTRSIVKTELGIDVVMRDSIRQAQCG